MVNETHTNSYTGPRLNAVPGKIRCELSLSELTKTKEQIQGMNSPLFCVGQGKVNIHKQRDMIRHVEQPPVTPN